MKINKINTFEEYKQLLEPYYNEKLYSNDYIQHEVSDLIAAGNLFEIHTTSNLFFLVKREMGMRVYYYLSNLEEGCDFSSCKDLVVEILFRGEKYYPQEEINYLCRCGFSVNLIRDQYSGMYRDLSSSIQIDTIKVEVATNLNEVVQACRLFNSSFDALSGDYLSEQCYDSLFQNKQIFIAKDADGNFLGALHQTLDKGIAWISHIAVIPKARGKHVGQALLSMFIDLNFTTDKQRYMLWVQQKNKVAVNMYLNRGFKYTNKSSISLVKY